MTSKQRRLTIEQLERISKILASIGETVDYTEFAIEALEQKPRTGHWIRGKYTEDDIRYNDSSYKCNKCGGVVDFK